MKKNKLIALFVILLSIFILAACTPTDSQDENGGIDTNITLLDEANAVSIRQYTLLVSDNATERERMAEDKLYYAIQNKCGAIISSTTDYLGKDEEISADISEIVIGKTNRKQFDDLKYLDYTVRREGKRIYICGGSGAATEKAVDHFITNYLSASGILIPDGGYYDVSEKYRMEALTVENVDIREFSIYADKESDAHKLQDGIGVLIGTELAITNKKTEGQHYIVLDNTSNLSRECEINIEGGNITLKGNKTTIADCIDRFISDYLNIQTEATANISSGSKKYELEGVTGMYTKEQILNVLIEVYNAPNKFIVGQQIFDEPSKYIDPFAAATGELPGIIGFDLGCYGLNLKTISDKNWNDRIQYITDYCKNGGIVTMSSHFDNPSDVSQRVRGQLGTTHSKETYEKNFKDLITEGTELNKVFMEELEINGKFLQDLRDNGVVVLWRPLHEMNGGWFWYGVSQNGIVVNADCIKNLWIYIHDYYTNVLGLDNLIWLYSPNVAPDAIRNTMLCYPGDDYVDMVGVDWYSSGNLEIEKENSYNSMTDATNMPGAIFEFGASGDISKENADEQLKIYNCMDFLDDIQALNNKGYKFSFVLGWTGVYKWTHLGKAFEFMESEYTLSQSDVKALLDAQ